MLIKLAGEGGVADNSVEERAGGAREADKTAGEGVAVRDKTAGESEAIRDKIVEGGEVVVDETVAELSVETLEAGEVGEGPVVESPVEAVVI